MALLQYLMIILLPFSFGYPNKNYKHQVLEDFVNVVPDVSSPTPESKLVVDFGCKRNEHFSFCSAHCQHNCTNLGLPIVCSEGCFPGCVCDDGYVRGHNNDCVLVEECNPNISEEEEIDASVDHIKSLLLTCPEKESYSWCNANCQSSCASFKDPIPCSDECVSGCICNAGFVRDLDGKCITTEQCLFTEKESFKDDFCPPNEVFSPCLAHCQKNCTNWSDPTTPCLKICVPGCICDNGMVRGPYGNCIRPRQCPASKSFPDVSENVLIDCPVNEHFDSCKAHCQKNCSNWNQEIKCKQACVSGCVCDKDFVRGPLGKCVLTEKCSSLHQNSEASIKKKNFHRCPDGEKNSKLQPIDDSEVYCTSGNGVVERCPPTYFKGCVCERGQIRGEDSHCIDRRLLPNANEIHFFYENVKVVPREREMSPRTIEESSDFIETSEKFTFDITNTTLQNEEFSTENNVNEEISTKISQQTSAENFINSDPDFHGCPDNQKCL